MHFIWCSNLNMWHNKIHVFTTCCRNEYRPIVYKLYSFGLLLKREIYIRNRLHQIKNTKKEEIVCSCPLWKKRRITYKSLNLNNIEYKKNVEEDVTCSLKDSPCLFPKICRKSRHSSDHNHKTWPQTWLGTRYPYDMLSFPDAWSMLGLHISVQYRCLDFPPTK